MLSIHLLKAMKHKRMEDHKDDFYNQNEYDFFFSFFTNEFINIKI